MMEVIDPTPTTFATVFRCALCGDRLTPLSNNACAACPHCTHAGYVVPPSILTTDGVEEFIRGMPRGGLSDREFTLIAGNIRYFAGTVRESMGFERQQ